MYFSRFLLGVLVVVFVEVSAVVFLGMVGENGEGWLIFFCGIGEFLDSPGWAKGGPHESLFELILGFKSSTF